MNDNEVTENLLSENPKPKSGKTKKIVIIAIIILIIIAAGFGGYYYYRQSEYQKNLELGQKFLDEGNFKEALIAFQDASSISTRHQELYPLLIQSALAEGDLDAAHQAIDQLEKVSSDPKQLAILKSQVVKQEGDFTQAMTILQDASKENPDDSELSYDINLVRNGNLPGNISNGGYVVYDVFRGTYFTADNKIFKYNNTNSDAEATLILETENGPGHHTIGSLSIWGNTLYYADSSSIKCCDLNGNNQKTLISEASKFFIEDAQIYTQPSDMTNYNSSDTDLKLNVYSLSGELKQIKTLYIDDNQRVDQWIVYNGNYYYTTTDSSYSYIHLYEQPADRDGPKEELASFSTDGFGFTNGLYPFNDILYFSIGTSNYEYHYIDLETGKSGEIKYTAQAGFNNTGFAVNGKDAFFGLQLNDEGEVGDIEVYNLAEQKITQTVNLNEVSDPNSQVWLGGTMTTRGGYLTPNAYYIDELLVNKGTIERDYMEMYRIDLNDWSAKCVYSGA